MKPLRVSGSGQVTYYGTVKLNWRMTLEVRGEVEQLAIGDVVTIDDVMAMRQTKDGVTPLDFERQFVVLDRGSYAEDGADDGFILITPPIITSGPYATVSQMPDDGAKVRRVLTRKPRST